jgi:hypothetical protein
MRKINVVLVLLLGLQLSSLNAQSWAESWSEKHPARAEVIGREKNQLDRDKHLNHEINHDKGNLSGHYGQLKSEEKNIEHRDKEIRHEERVDAASNGGHLTPGEAKHLNREENHVRAKEDHLQHQIHRDHD